MTLEQCERNPFFIVHDNNKCNDLTKLIFPANNLIAPFPELRNGQGCNIKLVCTSFRTYIIFYGLI